jgi:hypothetical protein
MKTIIDVNGVRTEKGSDELELNLPLKIQNKNLEELVKDIVETCVREVFLKFKIAEILKYEIKKEMEEEFLNLNKQIDEIINSLQKQKPVEENALEDSKTKTSKKK